MNYQFLELETEAKAKPKAKVRLGFKVGHTTTPSDSNLVTPLLPMRIGRDSEEHLSSAPQQQ